MTAVTKKIGTPPKAFILVPLIGAFFIDISNAIISAYLTIVIHNEILLFWTQCP